MGIDIQFQAHSDHTSYLRCDLWEDYHRGKGSQLEHGKNTIATQGMSTSHANFFLLDTDSLTTHYSSISSNSHKVIINRLRAPFWLAGQATQAPFIPILPCQDHVHASLRLSLLSTDQNVSTIRHFVNVQGRRLPSPNGNVPVHL